MVVPQIVYDPGTGPVILTFTYPPVSKPMLDDRSAVRHDSMTSSGLRQVALERVDILKPLTMDFVPWDDLPAWGNFIDFAIAGGQFAYYPDAAQPEFQTWELMDTDFKPKFSFRSISKFALQFRLVPGGASNP